MNEYEQEDTVRITDYRVISKKIPRLTYNQVLSFKPHQLIRWLLACYQSKTTIDGMYYNLCQEAIIYSQKSPIKRAICRINGEWKRAMENVLKNTKLRYTAEKRRKNGKL